MSPSATPSPIAGEPIFYKGWLLETPEITRSSPDDFWGLEEIQDVTIKISNHTGLFSQSIIDEEYRNKIVRLWSWDDERSEGNQLHFELAGRITVFDLTDIFEITVSPVIKEKLNASYPKVVYELGDWPEIRPNNFNPPEDFGKTYGFVWGRATHVPLTYVRCDYDGEIYDYILCHGPIKSVEAVYRDELKVPVSEYEFFNGSQMGPYAGYAFIRFRQEQRVTGTSRNHKLTADIYGFTYGAANECRNFVTNIRQFLTNDQWGANKKTNTATFQAAEAIVAGWGSFYHDGHVSEQKEGRDILNDMLVACRARLRMNQDDEWEIFIDNTDSDIKAYLGANDGFWNNIISIDGYSTVASDNTLKKVITKYRYDNWTSEYQFKYERENFDFGEEKEYELTQVRDHTTGDMFTCHIQKRAFYRDKLLNITAFDIRQNLYDLNETEIIHVYIPRLLIDADYKIKNITKNIAGVSLELISHNNAIYVYDAGTLNIEPVPDDEISNPDFEYDKGPNYRKPYPPINIGGIEWTFHAGPGGQVIARLLGTATKDPRELNFKKIMVGTREYDPTDTASYTWVDMSQYSDTGGKFIGPFGITIGEWRVYLDFVASTYPGGDGLFQGGGGAMKYFDAAVKSMNIHGQESDWVLFPHEEIPYWPIVPPDIETPSQVIIVKNFMWNWTFGSADQTATETLQDYHYQISANPDYSSPIVNTFTGQTSLSYLTDLPNGSTLYFRVRPRNTTLIEAWNWAETGGVVGTISGTEGEGLGSFQLPVCDEGIVSEGAWVNIYAPYSQSSFTCVRMADASEIGRECHGFVLDTKGPGELVTVYLPGNINNKAYRSDVYLGQIPTVGGYAYLSDNMPGAYSMAPPILTGHFIQKLGLPITSAGFMLDNPSESASPSVSDSASPSLSPSPSA